MTPMAGRMLVGTIAALFYVGTGVACAQEHPEHPKAGHSEGSGTKEPMVSPQEIGRAIRDFVAQDAKLKGGYFLIYDAKAGKPLALTLDRVHEDRLSSLQPDLHFACADFSAADGTRYDLDFFLQGMDAHGLTVTRIAVHQESGKERYTWEEVAGRWRQKPLAPEGSGSKKREEPQGSGSK